MLWSEDVISLNKKISDELGQVQFLTQLQPTGGAQSHDIADGILDMDSPRLRAKTAVLLSDCLFTMLFESALKKKVCFYLRIFWMI